MFYFENRAAMQEVINILKKRSIQTQQAQRASLQEAQQAQAAQQAQQPKPQARQQKPAGMNIYAMAFASRRLLKRNKRRIQTQQAQQVPKWSPERIRSFEARCRAKQKRREHDRQAATNDGLTSEEFQEAANKKHKVMLKESGSS